MRRDLTLRFSLALAGLLAAAALVAPLATRPADQTLPIYTDALAVGWGDWSWGGLTADLASPDPVYSGTVAIAVTYTGGWSGLQFGRDTPLDVSAYDTLRFYVHGGTAGGQQIAVYIGNDCSSAHQALTATAGLWTTVEIPLRSLGSTRQVRYVYWFNPTDGAQPTFYLDEIAFVAHDVVPSPTPTAAPGPNLAVDATASRHSISPYIYGMSFADEDLAAELGLPLRRWGGNATTRYNWQNDTANRGMDWYFENVPEPGPGLPGGSATDQFVEQDRRTGTATLLTVPLIGWTPASHDYACGFSVSKYGPQQSTDPWRADCGNGVHTDGTPITGNDPLDTSVPITPTFVQAWVAHLVGKYGSAAQGGVQFYNLDNEPMLWYDTHRDVHPDPTTYDEIRDRTYAYAAAIKASDPTAQTVGPALWGWTAYFWSALDWETPGFPANAQDREAHGGVPFLAWYLQQMQAYEQEHGQRILDYVDVHYYPQGEGIFSAQAGDEDVQALRLRSTRSLWDPNYVDESWIAEPVYLVPRLQDWVAENYTGTQTMIGEYSWGAMCHISGALAEADVLGIFGREGLDMAALWGPPASDEPGAFAFRIYRNYDGNGHGFGQTSVQATSADPDRLALYAAVRAPDGALTLVVVNKAGQDLTSPVAVSGFTPAGLAQVYRYSDQRLDAIVREPDLVVGPGGLSATFPARSITLVIIPPAGQPQWQVYLPVVERGATGKGVFSSPGGHFTCRRGPVGSPSVADGVLCRR
jgi:hypothetical protein